MNKKKMSFQRKLLITYLIISVGAIGIVGYASYFKSSQFLKNQLEGNSIQNLMQISNGVDSLYYTLNRMALVINSDEEVLQILKKKTEISSLEAIKEYKKMQNTIRRACGLSDGIGAFTIFAVDGREFSLGGKSVMSGYDYTKQDWYSKVQEMNKILIPAHKQEQIILSKAENVISYIQTIKDLETFENLGYIMIDCRTQSIEEIFGTAEEHFNNSIFILDQDNMLIYNSTYEACSKQQVLSNIKQYDFKPRVQIDTQHIDGEDFFIAYYVSTQSDLKIVSVTPLNEIYAEVKEIRGITLGIICMSILCVSLASNFISRGISKPIIKLIRNMKKFEKGEWELEIENYTNDEIGQLSQTFDGMVIKIKNMIKNEYQIKLAKKQAELQALQAQINPHFLYNTLGAIDGIAEINGNKDISEMCNTLSQLMRYNLEGGEEATLEKEIQQIQRYLFIEQKRHGERMSYAVIADKEVLKNKVLKLLIQPMVENAIIHGVDKKRGPVHISIVLSQTAEKKLSIVIRDTGKGMTENILREVQQKMEDIKSSYWLNPQKGRYQIGLGNVNYRVKLYYGDDFGISIDSKYEEYTIIELLLPIIEGEFK